ncbi:MAG: AMP-binding protein [Bdellovibrio sp.]|nr:AMP-binding protein [Bdellovibrio sp.]
MDTVLHRLKSWADEHPEDIAQRYKQKGEWCNITAKEYCQRVFWLAIFLQSKGFNASDVGAILSYNCPEWVHLDLAPLLLGGKSAGLYPNASFNDISYVLKDTQCKLLSLQNKLYFDKATHQGQVPLPSHIKIVLVFEGDASFCAQGVSYAQALEEGKKLAESLQLQDYLDRLDPKHGAFLIYTSGTTGNPKGALLSHDNLAYASSIAMPVWGITKRMGNTFSFLPLCHIAEKIQNIGAGLTCQLRVDYCSGFENIAAELGEVRPVLLLSVPRLWEKMVEGVRQKLSTATGLKKVLAEWAIQTGQRVAQKKYRGQALSLFDEWQLFFANRLVLSKIKKAMGLDQVKLAASGAASLPAYVANWFAGLGINILEVYGQTESTGLISMTRPGVDSAGTVGLPVPNTDFKIMEDGEICTKGRHVFLGYYNKAEATNETIIDGWLHSGDLGKMDEKGLLKIVGRKKEIMKSSGGKMVAPVPIEDKIKTSPWVAQACMVGDGRKYFSMLLTLPEGVKLNPEVEQAINKKIEEVNQELAGYEQIKYCKILANDFSIERGEMTPTMKMKRAAIEKNYKSDIDSMYMNS